VAPGSIDLPSDNQSCTWRYAGLHCRNATPFFAFSLQGSLMFDSARLRRECWSRNTENQNESRSTEFQQGKIPAETSKLSAFVLDWLLFVLVESAPVHMIVIYRIIKPRLISGQKISSGAMFGGLKHLL
jgi:hypothetical protein